MLVVLTKVMGNWFSAPSLKPRPDDHALSSGKEIEHRVLAQRVHLKGRRARQHSQRRMEPSRTRSVISGPMHGPRGAVQPPHRIRRAAATQAMEIPSAKKQHKRRDVALKAAGVLSDISQQAFRNKLMFGY